MEGGQSEVERRHVRSSFVVNCSLLTGSDLCAWTDVQRHTIPFFILFKDHVKIYGTSMTMKQFAILTSIILEFAMAWNKDIGP